jgi:anti-sigma factor RsiW
MTIHPEFDEIGDLLDGTLPAARAAEVRQHLEMCEECRVTLDALRATLAGAAALPRAIAPPPGLWSDVRGQLAPRRTMRTVRFGIGGLAAAALLAAAMGSGITALVLRPNAQRGPVTATSQPASVPLLSFASAERGYADRAARLELTLSERRDSLAPATVATVERSLRIADSAIAEARAALDRDPANRAIEAILASNYERKIDLLRRANELSPRT